MEGPFTDADSASFLQAGNRVNITVTLTAENQLGPDDSFTLEYKQKALVSSLISKSFGSGYAEEGIIRPPSF